LNLPNRKEAERQFEIHIRDHELLIHKVCNVYAFTQSDREDLFQEIVIQLWKSFSRYKGELKLSTWIYRVAINTAITGLRSKKDFIQSCDESSFPIRIYDDTSHLEEEDRVNKMYKAIEHLNGIEKALVMLYLEDKSYEEMEEILGINQGNLRVKMNRCKEKLRQLTKKY
jgi:RNA polymerase sigma factor (sigma-70 family)